jgi:hypothetical protein
VSELIEIASRFTDGEDSYNNKRVHSLEVDRANRQRHRSHNEDGHARRNQVAKTKAATDEISQNILTRQQKTCFMDIAASTMHT